MVDFSLQDLWWLKPKEQDNPLPALQLGVQIAQNKAQMDLRERDLANDIARTSLMREEMLAKQKIQTMLVAGNAEMASAIASVDDWTDDEQVSRVWETGARNPMTVGSKAWLGAQHMHESARTAKRLQEEAESRIAARTEKSELDLLKEERLRMLADSDLKLDDAKFRDIEADIAFAERRAKIQEGNLELRREELSQKGQRLSIRSQRMYDNELKALNSEEEAKLKSLSAASDGANLVRKTFNLKRRALTGKFYGDEPGPRTLREGLKTEDRTTNAPPAVVAPADTNIRRQGGNLFQQQPDGTWKFIGPAQ